MPEIKHSFAGGKMNKDLDERIVPQGEYRDAMNIQVRTTTGDDSGVGDAGAVQNIPGNMEIPSGVHRDSSWVSEVGQNPNQTRTVGSVADEKNNTAYFFVAGVDLEQAISSPKQVNSMKLFIDTIVEVDTGSGTNDASSRPIVVDKWAVVVPNNADTWTFNTGPIGTDFIGLMLTEQVISHLRVGMTIRALRANGSNALEWGTEIQNIVITEDGEGEGVVFLYSEHEDILWNEVECLVFEAPRVLNFRNPPKGRQNIISAINIIDNLLFWTDNQPGFNRGEPKKVNIDRCREGSNSNDLLDVWTDHTQLKLTLPTDDSVLVDYAGGPNDSIINVEDSLSPAINNDLREEHITVIRKAPRTAPVLEMSDSDRDGEVQVVGLQYDFYGIADAAGEEFEQGWQTVIENEDLLSGPDAPNWFNNDILVFTEEIGADETMGIIKATINNYNSDTGTLQLTILSISSNYSAMVEGVEGSGSWVVSLEQDKPLFELKFGRFACRYKYEDGEYSSFSPWSELAFLPGRYDYNYRKGYNLGMVNTLRSLKIKDFIPHQRTRNADVVAVEILYKNTESPNVYVVRSLTRGIDPEWDLFTPTIENEGSLVFGELTITSEIIHKVVEKDQLLRAWDNVPRYALAQEIAANRVVYGNYVQGYETGHVGLEQVLLSDNTATMEDPKKSIKTMRNYKFGMVFGDKYGRETPVIANGYITGDSVNNYSMIDGDISVEVEFAAMRNYFQLAQVWDSEGSSDAPDEWMEYVKYYVKETSNEYYNLIMDRWYEAEDGNIWLSFVSADRNKVDMETYLILKNGHGNNEPILQKARYKILAIEEEAPDFIKVDPRFMGKLLMSEADYDGIFSSGASPTAPDTLAPFLLMTESTVTISANTYNNFFQNYSGNQKGDLKVRVVGVMDGVELASREWKTITYYSTGDGDGLLRWNGTFGETADMLDRFQSQGYTVSGLQYYLEFKEEVVTNTFPQFDGKFFVKVERDDVLETNVMVYSGLSTDYDNTGEYRIGFISTESKHPTVNQNSRRASYSWFDSNSGSDSEVTSVDSSGDTFTNSDGSVNTWSESNVNCENIASVWTGFPQQGSGQALEDTWSSYGWNLYQFPFLLSLGCDGRVEGDLPDGVSDFEEWVFGTDPEWPMVTNGDACCGDGDYEFFEYQGNWVVNFAYATRLYWKWIHSTVCGEAGSEDAHGSGEVGYKIFIDNCRLKEANLQGVNQPQWSNLDYPDDGSVHRKYYRPTGLDRGWQTGDGFGQVPSDEYGRIFISMHGVDGFMGLSDAWGFFENSSSAMATFKNHMTTEGNMFRFKDCPGNNGEGYVYKIVGNADTLTDGRNYSKIAKNYSDSGYSNSWDAGCAWESCGSGHVCGDRVPVINMLEDYQTDQDNSMEVWNAFDNNLGMNSSIELGGDPFGPYGDDDCGTCGSDGVIREWCQREGFRVEFRRVDTENNNLVDNGTKGIDPFEWDPLGHICHDGREAMILYTVGSNVTGGEVVQPVKDAAVWETEPKEDVGLDIYYEASNAIPMVLTSENTPQFAPYHSKVKIKDTDGLTNVQFQIFEDHRVFHLGYTENTSIIGIESLQGNEYYPHTYPEDIQIGRHIVFEHPDGTKTMSRVTRYMKPADGEITNNTSEMVFVDNGEDMTGYYEIDSEVWQYPIVLSWFNCYSFGNGLESDRIRDDFNANTIDNGVKVSTTFLDYGEEVKGSGMIYSGIYNSISGVNNLNEFNMSEVITKDLNPSYGSIQAFKMRDTNIVVLTEDKVLQVTTNRDALYNADGNAQLLASNRVLGTAVPFSGEYGISDNPESLAADQYRMYFTDKQRGAVLRLSGNGITPISNVGMKTWFRENLSGAQNLLGTFDIVNGEYNLTLDYGVKKDNKTVSFNEGSKGWVSFKSFIPEEGVSVSGKYLTSFRGLPFEHYIEVTNDDGEVVNRNTFYDIYTESSIDVVFNDMPGSIKTFKTINYEGSQAKIEDMVDISEFGPDGVTPFQPSNGDGEYYNLEYMHGWWVENITTDLSARGSVEFKGKEGKWFNRIDGDNRDTITDKDISEFSVQGLGFASITGGNTTDATIGDPNDNTNTPTPTSVTIQIVGDLENNDQD